MSTCEKTELEKVFRKLWLASVVVFLRKKILRALHVFRLARYYCIDSIVCFSKSLFVNNSILLIKPDGIGDYILLRNFISIIKNHPKYRSYKITLCGNSAFSKFAETYDRSVIDGFIWFEPKKFQSRLFYRYKTLKTLRARGFDIVLYPSVSRNTLLGDSIVRCINAREKVGCKGDDVNSKEWELKIFNRFYTTLIEIPDNVVFEFSRNKYFFEKYLGIQITIDKPSLSISQPIMEEKGKYVVVCPDAQLTKKRWSLTKFIVVSEYLYNVYNVESIYVGGRLLNSQQHLIDNKPFIRWKVGVTNLQETTEIIACSLFVLSNDTAVSHIGVALNKPVIVISNGEHYGRFTYPSEVYNNIFYAFPPALSSVRSSTKDLIQKYKYGSFLDIDEVSIQHVEELVDTVYRQIEH